jgi:hypothetical protein
VAGDGYGAGVLNPEWCVSRAWRGFDSLVPLEQIPKDGPATLALGGSIFFLALSALRVGRDAVIPAEGSAPPRESMLSVMPCGFAPVR